MNVDYKLIGQRIKVARKAKGLTQEQLSEKLDVSVGYVSQLERGVTKISLDTLGAIAVLLDCDVAYFVTESAPKSGAYLSSELSESLSALSSEKKKLVYDFIKMIENK
ncbi:MAG: helix-turn-helix transcriptional regulator [Clostridia bacterium]|nr:helix-turn-helix transcriptional regulator [Clostridia bacterium]